MLQILKSFKELINLLRLEKSLIVILFPIVGAITINGFSLHNPLNLLFSGILYCLLWGASFAINDYFDIHIDKINLPNRILPSNRISTTVSFIWAIILYIVINLLTLLLYGFLPFLLIASGSVIGILYSWKLKLWGIPGDLAIFTISLLGVLFGDIIVNHTIRPQSAIIGLFIGCFMYGLQIMYSIRDIEGDKAYGSRSIAVRMGSKVAASVMIIPVFGALILLFYFFIIGMIKFNIFLMIIGSFLSVTGFYLIFKIPTSQTISRYHRIPEIGLIFHLISFIL